MYRNNLFIFLAGQYSVIDAHKLRYVDVFIYIIPTNSQQVFDGHDNMHKEWTVFWFLDIIKHAGGVWNDFFRVNYTYFTEWSLFCDISYLTQKCTCFSKILHSAVANLLIFEVNFLPGKEWFWCTKLFLLSLITKIVYLNPWKCKYCFNNGKKWLFKTVDPLLLNSRFWLILYIKSSLFIYLRFLTCLFGCLSLPNATQSQKMMFNLPNRILYCKPFFFFSC